MTKVPNPEGQRSHHRAVPVVEAALTESQQLFAMLHAHDGEVGTYEFGEVDGVDLPVITDDAPVLAPFQFTLTG